MGPDVSAVDDVLSEHGLCFALLDPARPLVMLSSTASVTEGGTEVFSVAEVALRHADTRGCILAIIIDDAGPDRSGSVVPFRSDRRSGPVFDVHIVGREMTRSARLPADNHPGLASHIEATIDDIIADSDIVG